MSHATLEARSIVSEQHYDRFEQNRRFEERTDIAERIGYPIRAMIAYTLENGHLYAQTDTKRRAFVEQTAQALQEAPYIFQGDQAFEVVRRSHEHDEALLVDALARGELGGNVLIKISKVPDAIVEGTTSIRGYRRDTLRTFGRIYARGKTGVHCYLFSLDHNDFAGLRAIEGQIGFDLTQRSSEDILADYRVIKTDNDPDQYAEEFIDEAIDSYDSAIFERTGQRRHAGSTFGERDEALAAVTYHEDIMAQHFEALHQVASIARTAQDKSELEETTRQATAAAIALKLRGTPDGMINAESIAHEVENGNYAGDCSLATPNAMQQGQNSLTENWKKMVKQCPKCLATNVIASKDGEWISGTCGCHLNVCTGDYWQESATKINKSSLFSSLIATPNRDSTSKNFHLKPSSGKYKAVPRLVVGGITYDWVDRVTGEVVTANNH